MNQLGIIINLERKIQNMSQAALCEGICSVSYLSKIENLEVIPPRDILKMLVEALGYSYEPIENLPLYHFETAYQEILDDYYCFLNDDALEKISYLLETYEKTDALSDLSFDLILMHLLKNSLKETLTLESLQTYRAFDKFLNNDQRYLLDCLYFNLMYLEENFEVDERDAEDQYGVLTLLQAFIDFKHGRYSQALTRSKRAYARFVEQGNFKGMIHASSISCSCYANLKEYQKHIEEASKILKLNRITQNKTIELEIHYNIGATYLTQGKFQKARYHLEKGYEHIEIKPGMRFLFLEKLGLTYALSGDSTKLSVIMKELKSIHGSDALITLLNTINKNDDYLKHPAYLDSIEQILSSKDYQLFGRSQMYAGMLYHGYRAQYQYRKCLDILEKYELTDTLPSLQEIL